MVTSPRAAINNRRESHLPIYLCGRQVRQAFIIANQFLFSFYINHGYVREKLIMCFFIVTVKN